MEREKLVNKETTERSAAHAHFRPGDAGAWKNKEEAFYMAETINSEPLAARILIADDEEIFSRPLAEFLRLKGYLCDCACNSEQAVAALAEHPYDLLITDINMPGNRNLELLRDRLQSAGFMPIIVVTGYPSLHTAVESLRLAVVDYVTKPLNMTQFLETVRSALQKGEAIRLMRSARSNFSNWLEQMGGMEDTLLWNTSGDSPANADATLDWYLAETVNRISNLSMSLMTTVSAMKRTYGEKKTDICSLMNCPRLAAYERAIRQTVEVLIQTKSAFKSRELADQRKRLENLLHRTELD